MVAEVGPGRLGDEREEERLGRATFGHEAERFLGREGVEESPLDDVVAHNAECAEDRAVP